MLRVHCLVVVLIDCFMFVVLRFVVLNGWFCGGSLLLSLSCCWFLW